MVTQTLSWLSDILMNQYLLPKQTRISPFFFCIKIKSDAHTLLLKPLFFP